MRTTVRVALAVLLVTGAASTSNAGPTVWVYSGHITFFPDWLPPCSETDGEEPCNGLSPFFQVGDPWSLTLRFDPAAMQSLGPQPCIPPQGWYVGPMQGSLSVAGKEASVEGGGMSLATYSDVGCTEYGPDPDFDPGPHYAEIFVFFGSDFPGIPNTPLLYLRFFTHYPQPLTGDFPDDPPGGGYFELVDGYEFAVLYGDGQLVGAVPEPTAIVLLAIGASLAARRLRQRRAAGEQLRRGAPI
jgi:hypothetical protein